MEAGTERRRGIAPRSFRTRTRSDVEEVRTLATVGHGGVRRQADALSGQGAMFESTMHGPGTGYDRRYQRMAVDVVPLLLYRVRLFALH